MTGMTASFLDEDAILPEEIQPLSEPVDFAADPARIFITGATGFVAAYVMAELLDTTPAHLYALVRADDVAHGMARIRKNLAHYWLWKEAYAERITPVIGDLKHPLLGLSSDDFAALARRVEVIYHVGSKLSYIAPYEFLRTANVGGTVEALRLATTGRAKPFHFVSSLGILLGFKSVPGAIPQGGLETDALDAEKCPDVGYFQTKYVSERVVRHAADRGIPVTIHRIGLIVGDSRNGRSNEDDFVARILIGCIQAGYGPDIKNAMDMTPVDYAARSIVHLSRQPESVGKVFHILNPDPITWSNIMDTVIEAGYPVRKLPFNEWVDAIEEHEDPMTNPLHPLLPFFHIQFAGRMLGVSETAYYALGTKLTQSALDGSGLRCATVDGALVRTFLAQYVETGRLRASMATA
ncbi:MAG: thioester reductase domain-containing protein [Anaerolineae bacterium]|nr:thioester reductase domain-containing protein [Anaerolineae bacterium]NUQ04395.1 thioester reductase domain-containing protein [Anaerolineae bacterium]